MPVRRPFASLLPLCGAVALATCGLALSTDDTGNCVVVVGGRALAPRTHAVVLGADPVPGARYAAQELQEHLRLITGKALPVVGAGDLGERTPLAVGRSAVVDKLAPEIDFEGLGSEGTHVKTIGPALVMVGSGRGTIYAVYDFLERDLGCRWFSEDCATWPDSGRLEVGNVDRRYLPPLEYRDMSWPYSMPATFGVRSRLNGASLAGDDVPGGRVSYARFVHTFSALVPPKAHFDECPEYYALVDGERRTTQLCLTNSEVLRIATETVREWIRANPHAAIVSVSQNDNGGYCRCERCAALAAKEGSQAGPILHFVNAVADAVAEDAPGVLIDTLAYRYSRKPPRHVRPHPNVIVRVCSIECVFNHPIATHLYNQSFREDMQGWSRICDRLYVWDYVVNFHHAFMPHPNLYVLKPNIDFFIRNGVKGVFETNTYYTPGAELAELRRYVLAKTLWDPTCDTDTAIDEFCRAYYGPAGAWVRRYVNLLHASMLEHADVMVACGGGPLPGYLSRSLLGEAAALFDRAEEAVRDDPVRLHRVRVARLPVVYSQLNFADAAPWREADGRLAPQHDWDVPKLGRRFLETAKAAGVLKVRESPLAPWAPLQDPAEWLATVTRKPRESEVVSIANPALRVDMLPQMGGRLWRIVLRQGECDVLLTGGSPGAWQPGWGGYEEYSQAGWRSPGWWEPYAVAERGKTSVTLNADLAGGLRLRRRVALDEKEAVVTITSSLTNTTDVPRPACLRVHPSFAVSYAGATRISAKRPDGTWRAVPLPSPGKLGGEVDVWLADADLPAGEWALLDAGTGLLVVNRWDPAQVWKCFVNANPLQSRVNLELFSHQAELAPGESLSLTHTYTISRRAAGPDGTP